MQFATLFLIASVVLALPSGSADSNAFPGHLKRADGFVFPNDDAGNVYVPNKDTKVPTNGRIVYPDEFESDYTLKEPDTRIHFPDEDYQAQKGQDQSVQTPPKQEFQYHKFNDATDNNNNRCDSYKDIQDPRALPFECYRPYFCNYGKMTRERTVCDVPKFYSEELDQEELIKNVNDIDCMATAICRNEDVNHLPLED